MKKILLLGASSNVGFNFLKYYSRSFDIIPLSRSLPENNDLNITKSSFKTPLLSEKISEINPDFIINCIAIGNVDYCESNKFEAKETNFNFVKKIVDLCKINPSVKLIHFSSNAVYSGKNPPYDESSKAEPINYYGYTKKLADDYIRENLSNYLILRPISIYGCPEPFQRNNPINWLLDELIANKKISLVDDIYANMLFVDDASKAIKNSIIKNYHGELNLSSKKSLSLYEIGQIACDILQIDSSLVQKIDSSKLFEESRMAPRPKDTSFNNQKARIQLDMEFKSIEEGISKILKYKRNFK